MKSSLAFLQIFTLVFFSILNSACAGSIPKSTEEKPTIYYVYDPMCGWCYGFTETVLKLKEKYKDQVKFKVVAGGLIPHDSVPVTNFKEYVLEGGEYFEQETGVSYGSGFKDSTLLDTSVYVRSMEPAKAILIVQEADPENAVNFLVKVQQAIFYDGIHPMVVEAYLPYLKGFNITSSDFLAKMNDPKYTEKVEEGYHKAAQAGVSGYPVLLYLDNGMPKFIVDGHVDFEKANKKMEKALKKL